MSVNEIIKKRRIELNLTLKDVAKALNVSESTISRYETNEIQNMGIDKIEALAKVLRCSPAYLMGWNDEPALNNKDKKDIEKSLEELMNELDNDELTAYGGEISQNDKELFKIAFENALQVIKLKNKEKYTPKKYKK